MTRTLQYIQSCLAPVDFDTITTVAPKTCRDFEQLVEIYKQDLTVTESLIDCLAICSAVHISSHLDGDPLWMYLVGPASCGKSTLCELVSSDELHSKPLSKITGLISGHSQGTHLLPLLKDKCVIIKDGTLLLESSQQQITELFGELRDIYDGSLAAHFRNNVGAVNFEGITFSMIIGITERVYKLNMAALGERFLHCRMETTRSVEQERNRKAIEHVFRSTHKTSGDAADGRSFPTQRSYTAGFLGAIYARIRDEEVIQPKFTSEDVQLIQALADILACSRAQAAKDKNDEVLYESRPEAATRVCKQLARIALALCYVFNETKITGRIKYLTVKLALDSSFGRQYSLLREINLSQVGMTRQGVSQKIGVPLTSTNRIIDDLISMKVVSRERERKRKSSGMGNDFLSCPEWIEDAFRLAEKYETNQDSKKGASAGTVVHKGPHRKKKKKSSSKRSIHL